MNPKTLVLDKLNLLVPVGTLLVGALVILPLVSPGNGAKEFPLVGAELGSFQARRKYFLRNALQLHADAYKKVSAASQWVCSPTNDVSTVYHFSSDTKPAE